MCCGLLLCALLAPVTLCSFARQGAQRLELKQQLGCTLGQRQMISTSLYVHGMGDGIVLSPVYTDITPVHCGFGGLLWLLGSSRVLHVLLFIMLTCAYMCFGELLYPGQRWGFDL